MSAFHKVHDIFLIIVSFAMQVTILRYTIINQLMKGEESDIEF